MTLSFDLSPVQKIFTKADGTKDTLKENHNHKVFAGKEDAPPPRSIEGASIATSDEEQTQRFGKWVMSELAALAGFAAGSCPSPSAGCAK